MHLRTECGGVTSDIALPHSSPSFGLRACRHALFEERTIQKFINRQRCHCTAKVAHQKYGNGDAVPQ